MEVVDQEIAARFRRLETLGKTLSDYQSALAGGTVEGADKRTDRLAAFHPVPQRARVFHAAMDQDAVREVLAILAGLPEGEVMISEPGKRNDGIGIYRQTTRWLQERILLAEGGDVLAEIDRTLRFLDHQTVSSLIDGLVRDSLLGIVLPAIAARLDLVRGNPQIVGRLQRLRQPLAECLRRSVLGLFIEELETTADPKRFMSLMWNADAEWWEPFYAPLRLRSSRAPALRLLMNQIGELAALSSARELAVWSHSGKTAAHSLREWHPLEHLTKINQDTLSVVVDMRVQTWVHLDLMLAHLHDQPWPIDPFDPAGLPLRKLVQDDVVLGAYSFSSDRTDNGGHRSKDRHFLLFGPWVPPEQKPAPTPSAGVTLE
jgi:hypothetical protein